MLSSSKSGSDGCFGTVVDFVVVVVVVEVDVFDVLVFLVDVFCVCCCVDVLRF